MVLHPKGWPPKGYANGIKARGAMIFVGGMVGWDERGHFPKGFAAQARRTLKNIAAVLAEATSTNTARRSPSLARSGAR